MSVIIGKAWYRLKQATGTDTESKTKLRVQASSGTGWKTSTDIANAKKELSIIQKDNQ